MHTIKLGYNDHGYNASTAITEKNMSSFYVLNVHYMPHKCSNGYNKVTAAITIKYGRSCILHCSLSLNSQTYYIKNHIFSTLLQFYRIDTFEPIILNANPRMHLTDILSSQIYNPQQLKSKNGKTFEENILIL